MTAFIFSVLKLVGTLVQRLIASLRPRASLAAENLFLRRQLALYRERNVKARLPDQVVRFTLAYLSRLFDWRSALVLVQPRTLILWHRAGFRLFWKWKSRSGCPPIPIELRKLIKQMAKNIPLLGEERIANELHHNPPHFHVRYGGDQAVIEIQSGLVTRGQLPSRALALVQEWIELHRNELLEDWNLCQTKQTPKPIEPLK